MTQKPQTITARTAVFAKLNAMSADARKAWVNEMMEPVYRSVCLSANETYQSPQPGLSGLPQKIHNLKAWVQDHADEVRALMVGRMLAASQGEPTSANAMIVTEAEILLRVHQHVLNRLPIHLRDVGMVEGAVIRSTLERTSAWDEHLLFHAILDILVQYMVNTEPDRMFSKEPRAITPERRELLRLASRRIVFDGSDPDWDADAVVTPLTAAIAAISCESSTVDAAADNLDDAILISNRCAKAFTLVRAISEDWSVDEATRWGGYHDLLALRQ